MTKAITCTLIGRLDPGGLARLGARSGAGAAVARSAMHPSPDHARSSAAHALRPGVPGARTMTASRRSGSRTAPSIRTRRMRSTPRSARSSRPCRARCSATSTAASTCWARSSASRSSAAACRTVRRSIGLLADRLGMRQLPALGRYRRQPDRVRRRLRDVARLRQAGRAVRAGRRVGRRAAAAAGLGRLRADPDAHRHQLRGLFPHQRRSAVPRSAGGYRLGVRRVGPAHLHPAPAIGWWWRWRTRPIIRWTSRRSTA